MISLSVINRIADIKTIGLDATLSGAPINHPNANSLRLLMMVSDLVVMGMPKFDKEGKM
ncbi:MAG: hypothetical protein P8L66_10510 [Rhodospirillaceae bacterium]|nr:hypothetical protein [Rhodospirillaceae bacterium]